jgi:NAD(P)-dependent dehydrogenase (short-subunit alcohol dehydrogenase family)
MRVVLADIEQSVLEETAAQLRTDDNEILTVVTDVSKPEQVKALAAKTIGRFGAVHLLFNNAGVAGGMNSWQSTRNDWNWVIGVNLMGVVHGLQAFVPLMLKHGEPAHIVNTASIAGLISGSSMAAYRVTKHAVVALSETLYLDLRQQEAQIGVSVLCPAWVRTGITDSERNRPKKLNNRTLGEGLTIYDAQVAMTVQNAVDNGSEPQEIAELTFDAIRDDLFYILPHREYKRAIGLRFNAILDETSPIDPW